MPAYGMRVVREAPHGTLNPLLGEARNKNERTTYPGYGAVEEGVNPPLFARNSWGTKRRASHHLIGPTLRRLPAWSTSTVVRQEKKNYSFLKTSKDAAHSGKGQEFLQKKFAKSSRAL